MTADGHGERLSPVDASFLTLESSSAHMHVAWTAIVAAPRGAPPSIEQLRARVAARLASVPRCRQRLQPAPLGLGDPCWVDDPQFDIANHVVELGDRVEAMSAQRFADARDALLSTPLDHASPLWQLAFVPRLSDGRMAIVGRVHHAMADGAAALRVAMLGLDVDGEQQAMPAPWRPAPVPGMLRRALEPLVHGAAQGARAARDVARACERPRSAARRALRDAGRAAQALTEDLLPRAPASQLNGTLGPRRVLVQHRVPLAELRVATRHSAATRNDAGIAIIAGALRALALERGAPVHALKALVPVNVRRADEADELGNRVSMMAVWLPLEVASPRERLDRVQRQTTRLKLSARPLGAHTMMSGFGLVPSALRAPVLRAAAPSRFNLTISSVVGPRRALHLYGARVEEIYPVIPLAEEQALSIGTLAYEGHLHFGLYADPDALPHANRLAELIDDEVRALLRAHSHQEVIHDAHQFAAAPVGA
ncbi:MAG: diacylglycerol O-acyltransferase / wax synthase [bacterium]